MANILFKRGLLKDLPKTTGAVEGALYFTTDEGGLYLGIENGKTKRIQGVVQQYPTLSDFQNNVKPPYDADVIFYISENGALVKWVEAKGEVAAHFEVLNVTAAEFATEVAAREVLAGRVTEAETTIGGHTTAINGINTSIGSINTLIGDINTAIEDITKDGGTIDNKVSAASTALTTEINKKADASTVETLSGTVQTLSGTVASNKSAIEKAVEDTKSELEGKIGAKADQASLNELTTTVGNNKAELQGQIDLKADTSALNALAGTVATNETDIENKVTALTGRVSTNEGDIVNIKETLSALTGGDSGEGSTIAEMIENAIDANNILQNAIDEAQDAKIKANEDNIGTLTTNLNNLSTNLSNNYYTSAQIDNKGYAVATDVARDYVAKEDYNTTLATLATKGEVNSVKATAEGAQAQATTNTGAISTLRGEYDAYVISNNNALAGVKATAEAAATKADFDQEKIDVRALITSEENRAKGVESGLQTAINGIDGRVADIETWFKAEADEDTTIENLTELLKYLEDHQGEATDMAADIQVNKEAIEDIKEEIGKASVPATEGTEKVDATGLHARIEALESGLGTEITTRASEDTRVLREAKSYTDGCLTWGNFID